MSGGIGEIRGDLIIGADLKGLDAGEAGLKGFQATADATAKSIGGMGSASAGGVQATVDLGNAAGQLADGIGRVAAVVGDAVVAAADYNLAVTNIGTLSSETNARLGEYEQGILSVSAALGQDATNSAKAAYDALSSGVEAGDAVAFLGVAGKAATAGLSSMDVAGKALTVTLNSFNLNASETTAVSDAMFQAANVGVTTFDELAQSFGGVASIANASGAGYKETLAVLAQITTKGVGTSEAVTQMKAAFTALSKPTEDVKASLQAAGFASAEAAIKSKGLAFVLDLVRQTSIDTGKPLIELVGSSEAVNAILTTTGENAGQTAEKIASLQASAGATASAFALISETPAQKMNVMRASVNNLVITLGNALLPVLGALLDGLNPLIQGLTRFAAGVLGPLSAAFSALPGPIKIVIAGMAGLVVAGIALTGAVIGLQLAFGPAVAAIGAAGGISAVASVGFGALGGAISSVYAVLAPLLLPLAALVGLIALVGGSLHAANKAWDEQRAAAVEAGGSLDAFTQAAAQARTESGLLANIGFALKDSMAAGSDQWKIGMAAISESLTSAKEGVSEWLASLRGDGSEADAVGRINREIASNKQVTIDAGAAFLELSTNMTPAVRESEEFQLAQAKLNEQLRHGDITSAEYKTQLLALADSTSKAAGAGAVLTKAEQERSASVAQQLANSAKLGGVLSDAALQSETFAQVQQTLSEKVAQGTLSYQDAQSALAGFASNQAAAADESERALQAYSLTAEGLDGAVVASEEFKTEMRAQAEAVAAGSLSLQDAQANLKLFAEQASAAKEAASFDLSGGLQSFGVQRVSSEDDMKDQEKAAEEAANTRAELFSEYLQARKEQVGAEQALASENATRLADAERKAQEEIGAAQAKGNADSIAKAQEAAAKRIATVTDENAKRVTELRSGFAAEQAERQTAIAQASLDQVNAMLRLGSITEQQAQVIFGSLKSAFPGAELFDPAAEAQLRFNAQFGQAVQGDIAAAVGLGEAIKGIDASLTESEGKAGEYASTSIAAYDAAKASLGGISETVPVVTDALGTLPAGAQGAADGMVAAGDTMRGDADATSANLQANADVRNATREAELQKQVATGDGIREDLSATGSATEVWASGAQVAAGKAGAAHTGFQQQVQTAGQQVGQAHSRMQGEMATTGTIATGSIGGLGKTYTGAAADIKVGGADIAKSAETANKSLASMGEGTTSAVAPARVSIQGLSADMVDLGDSAGRVGEGRVEAEEGAGEAAKTAGDDTVSSFRDQTKAGETLERKVVDLKKAFEGLPKKIDIPLQVLGLDKAHKALQQLAADLKAATGKWTVTVDAKYTGKGPMAPDKSIQLQHDIEDAIAAAKPGVNLAASYAGSGAMGWSGQGLALANALSGLSANVNPFVLQAEVAASAEFQRLIFDQATIQANLARTNAEYAALTRQIEEMGNAINRAGTAAEGARQAIQGALQGFFQGGGLDQIIAQFRDLGVVLGSDFFVQAGILDAATFDDVRQQLAALAGDPEAQQDLWKAVIDALANRWKVYYEELSNAQEREKTRLERQIRDAKKANPEADVAALEAALEDVNYQLDLLKDKNDDVQNSLRDQTFQVGAQFDAWDRINDALEDQQRAQADLERQRDKARKDAEDALKAAQKLATDAEDDAHGAAMDAIDAEIEARKAARDRDLEAFERAVKAQEKLLEAQRDAEEEAHKQRLSAITAEVDAEDARIKQEEASIDRANTLLDIFKNGLTPLTQEQKDYLAALGIDVESLTAANQGLAATKSLLDDINAAISKLPDDKPTRGVLSESQRAALQGALDAGLIDPKDRRVVDVALAGRSVRLDKIRSILEGTTGSLQDQTKAQEDHVDQAEQILKDLKLQLDLREQSNEATRDALQGDIEAENRRYEDRKAHLGDELAALKEQQAAAKERWDAELEALDQARKAEEDRHKARMTQLQEEYALELLKLGKTDEEIQGILAEQAKRAKTIADEAQRRFAEWLKEVERLRAELAARESQIEPPSGTPGAPPPAAPENPQPIVAPAPIPPGLPGPIPPPTTDSMLSNTLRDAVELKSVMSDLAALGFKAPNNFTVNQTYNNGNTFSARDVTVQEGSAAEDALLDALGRR
jgi:TP901 family phage tail tape measure protein